MGWRQVAIAAALLLVLVGSAKADPLTIRVGWVQTPGHLAPLVEALGKAHPEVSSISARAM
ncbi:MAG TPA: hypothetical protein VHU15_14335 [Stellaceae bacterium]|nr:hypothetical protein [Stellaceae bacterium]